MNAPITARLGVAESWLRAAIAELDGAHASTTYSSSRDAADLSLRDELATLSVRLTSVLGDTEALAQRLATAVPSTGSGSMSTSTSEVPWSTEPVQRWRWCQHELCDELRGRNNT